MGDIAKEKVVPNTRQCNWAVVVKVMKWRQVMVNRVWDVYTT